MTLKQQIEATIQAYKQACNYKNLNYNYCFDNYLVFGICHFTEKNKLDELYSKIKIDKTIVNMYLCNTPTQLIEDLKYNKGFFYKIKYKIYLYQLHQTRLQYLRNLLNSLPNDSDN